MGVRWTETEDRTQPGAAAPAARRAADGMVAAVLALQRSAGNRAVCRLLDGRRHLLRGKHKGGGAGSAEQQAVKAAPNQSQYQFTQLLPAVQNAIQQILNGSEGPFLRPARDGRKAGYHGTDPETGVAKGEGIGVREYHVVAHDESKRIVVRTQGQDKRVYYDPSHGGGTYTYHRVNGAPFPAPPAPAPAPAPAVVPAAPVPVAPVAPVAAAVPVVAPPAPVPDNWDD